MTYLLACAQIYYAEQRKKVVYIQCEEFDIPSRIERMIGSRHVLPYEPSKTFEDKIKKHVDDVISNKTDDTEDASRKNIEEQVHREFHPECLMYHEIVAH